MAPEVPAPVGRRRSRTPPRRNEGRNQNGNQGGNNGNGGGKGGNKGGGGPVVKTASTYQGKTICKRYNDNRGSKGKTCPSGDKHVCDVIKDNGQPCGSTKHNRQGHR